MYVYPQNPSGRRRAVSCSLVSPIFILHIKILLGFLEAISFRTHVAVNDAVSALRVGYWLTLRELCDGVRTASVLSVCVCCSS